MDHSPDTNPGIGHGTGTARLDEQAAVDAPALGATTARRRVWASTMAGVAARDGLVLAHAGAEPRPVGPPGGGAPAIPRDQREAAEAASLAPGATLAHGSGNRAAPEEPDRWRTCFERDRDRILHAAAFRRLAGKTQVFVHPADHQRTRLTHALEVAQVATAVARAVGLNTTLVEAMALGHDCGHGPGGHASEDAFEVFVPGFHHARWGADVVLARLNLCAETLDGIRNHSWSLPAPTTPEGEVLSWADRIAYCTHDLEDAVRAGIVDDRDLPEEVVEVAGRTRSAQLRTFITALVVGVTTHGAVGMAEEPARALAALRSFNYERIYMRPASVAQADAVVAVLRALVEFYIDHPWQVPEPWPDATGPGTDAAVDRAVTYVAGMTDRFAFDLAVDRVGWPVDRLPRAVDTGIGGLTAVNADIGVLAPAVDDDIDGLAPAGDAGIDGLPYGLAGRRDNLVPVHLGAPTSDHRARPQ